MEHYCGYRVVVAPGKRPKVALLSGRIALLPFSCPIVRHARVALSAAIALAFAATRQCLPAAAQQFIANAGYGGAGIQPLPGLDSLRHIFRRVFAEKHGFSSASAYDSNILRTQSNAIQDYIFFVTPAFDLTRDGGNHIEEVFASVTTARYANSEADDFTNAYRKGKRNLLLSPSSQVAGKCNVLEWL